MIIKQADLFYGLNHNFIKDLISIASRTSCGEGDIVFRSGEPATHFFILIKGCVRLRYGHAGREVFTSCRIGEIFGWSSLIGRQAYSASAECLEPAALLKIDRQQFQSILEKDLTSGLLFFKQLAAALGSRLIQLYERETQTEQTAAPSLTEAAT
ncbi:MAG: cyclic nucleotide-binding domain-containing protein [Deltaproteobacteria bacterium]|jgi:CRP-like cAMP-binding protein|nr:cyclic nucleotide-binding domain-containing protein [Deltaproteobacteria bacterium]